MLVSSFGALEVLATFLSSLQRLANCFEMSLMLWKEARTVYDLLSVLDAAFALLE